MLYLNILKLVIVFFLWDKLQKMLQNNLVYQEKNKIDLLFNPTLKLQKHKKQDFSMMKLFQLKQLFKMVIKHKKLLWLKMMELEKKLLMKDLLNLNQLLKKTVVLQLVMLLKLLMELLQFYLLEDHMLKS